MLKIADIYVQYSCEIYVLTLHFEFGSTGNGCLCKRKGGNAIQEAEPNKVFGPQKKSDVTEQPDMPAASMIP